MRTLTERTLGGLFWTASSQGGTFLLTLLYNVVLARILAPDDFGLFGMALVFTGLVGTLFSLGLGTAIIQRQDIGEKTYTSVFWVNLVFGGATAAVVSLGAPTVASYFGEVRLESMLRVMALNGIFGSFATVPVGLLSKRMEFRKKAGATVFSMLLAFSAAVIAALAGAGHWSIVLGSTLQILLNAVFCWRASAWMPARHFSLEALKPVISFGIFKTLFTLGSYCIRNIDLLMVGKMLGPEALGYYTIAMLLARAPSGKVKNVVGLVAFPAFAQIQSENERIVRNVYRAARGAILVLLPLVALLFLFADEIITVLYGAKWSASIPVLKLLLVFTVPQALNLLMQTIIMSKGRADTVFVVFLGESALLFALIYGAIPYGLQGVAGAVCLVAVAGVAVRFFLLRRLVGIEGKMFWQRLRAPFLVNGGILLALLSLKRAVTPTDLSIPVLAVAAAAAGALLLFGEWLIMEEQEKRDARGILAGAGGKD